MHTQADRRGLSVVVVVVVVVVIVVASSTLASKPFM